jgi:acyl-CoA thioesterase FadM
VSDTVQLRDDRSGDWRFAGEYIANEAPFTVRRTVRWAECDPAGVVYLGNFPHYLLSAVHLFRHHSLDVAWVDTAGAQDYQTPGKAFSMVFQSSLWPDDMFDMAVYIGDVRKHTLDVLVQATRADNGDKVFAGSITSVFVSRTDRHKLVEIPPAAREQIEGYRANNRAPSGISEALRPPR